jgi:Domain of unknown function (DUF4173)
MMQGTPHSIATDGWWLEAAEGAASPPKDQGPATGFARSGRSRPLLGLLLLVVLADLLFWHHAPGLSVALFAATIFAVATVDTFPRSHLVRPAALLAFGALPVVEHVQVLSLAWIGLALTAALLWARHPVLPLPHLPGAALIWIKGLPLRWVVPPVQALMAAGRWGSGAGAAAPSMRSFLRGWAFPIGGTLVFASLLLDANPVLAQLFTWQVDLGSLVERGLFWGGVALLVAPFLDASLPTGALPPARPLRLPGLGINAASVLRGLVLFNLMIGVQVVTDASILIGGADLPQGMSYAEYAHRGAYPLLATALLAGAFALAARPFLAEHPAIRPLMLLWLGQNVVLCGAAMMRLDLYVDAYGLTYLRLHSLIWMALVAVGLAVTLWQVVAGHDNRWVLLRTGAAGLATLYVAAFVNFAGVIAARNVETGHLDGAYLCQLGPMAAGALRAGGVMDETGWVDQGGCFVDLPQVRSWQEWGFRTWRVQSYVAYIELRGVVYENPGRR